MDPERPWRTCAGIEETDYEPLGGVLDVLDLRVVLPRGLRSRPPGRGEPGASGRGRARSRSAGRSPGANPAPDRSLSIPLRDAMSPVRPMSFWVAMLAVALLGLLGPLAHICPADPRWLVSSPDDPDVDDSSDLILADAGMLDTVPVLSVTRGGGAPLCDDGGPATS